MVTKRKAKNKPRKKMSDEITAIIVKGFKSICEECRIEIRPLTILAGANSSGKSSIMQPILLLKQTLEAPYDPGPLMINGPNVKFTSEDQLLSYSIINEPNPKFASVDQLLSYSAIKAIQAKTFSVGFKPERDISVTTYFKKKKKGFDIEEVIYDVLHGKIKLRPNMKHKDVESMLPSTLKGLLRAFNPKDNPEWIVKRVRCALEMGIKLKGKDTPTGWTIPEIEIVYQYIRHLIHVPGLRGIPERSYPVTATDSNYMGTFEKYVASIIEKWQDENEDKLLRKLTADLKYLDLTNKVKAVRINDAQIEIKVGMLPQAPKEKKVPMVNIADVGFGVSQVLPVLVALLVAEKGQFVYIEQPELHLHPLAQRKMAKILADAAKRGVKVVAETHSSLLLRSIQTLVAKGRLKPELIKLHWFKRKTDGSTKITSADLDENGAFGDWPSDFDDVGLKTEKEYLDAAESRAFAK